MVKKILVLYFLFNTIFAKTIEQKIYFQNGKFAISDEAKENMDIILDEYDNSDKNTSGISIEGYSSKDGNNEFNIILSNRRADIVKLYLIDKGIPEHRISIASFGSQKIGDRKNNRLVIIKLIN